MPKYLAINLARSSERWAELNTLAKQCGIELTRIEAVNGRNVDESDWQNFNIQQFRDRNGKHPAAGEYGCYQSHVAAIEYFAKSADQSAVILEDDATLTKELVPFCAYLDEHFLEAPLIVRLCTHRQDFFEELHPVRPGVSLGQCWHGPTGSASAYWMNKAAAQKLLKSVFPASLPFDIMLERPWGHGVPIVLTGPSLLKKPRQPLSTITETRSEKHRKFPWYRRGKTYLFRTVEFFKRIIHCTSFRKIPTL